MGELIAYNAAASDILADVQMTWERALLRGGIWESEARGFFSELMEAVARTRQALSAAQSEVTSTTLRLQVLAKETHLLVTGAHDTLWQALGRPAHDLLFKLLFPRGPGSHTRGPLAERPAKILLLAELLVEHVHPRLDPDRCDALALALQQQVAQFESAIAASMAAKSRYRHHAAVERMHARTGHRAMANYKRILLGRDLRQPEIHEVIPAHARRKRSNERPANGSQPDSAPQEVKPSNPEPSRPSPRAPKPAEARAPERSAPTHRPSATGDQTTCRPPRPASGPPKSAAAHTETAHLGSGTCRAPYRDG